MLYSSVVQEVSPLQQTSHSPSSRQFEGQVAGHGLQPPVAWGWLAGLTALAIVLRAIALNQQLWFDEIVTLLNSARAPLWQIVTQYSGQNQHTLYSILAHGSIRLFGEQPWALRLPAAAFGVASIPALYFFARLVTSNLEALAACALMTVNYQHIWFSQNARGYTAMAFWTLLSTTFFLRAAEGGRRRDWIPYAIAASLGIYTHLMVAFVVAAHVVVYLWMMAGQAKADGRVSRRWSGLAYGFALCGAMSLLLYAPLIRGIASHTVGQARDHAHYQWASPLWALAEMGRGLRSTAAGGWLALAIGGAILLCGSLSYWKQNRYVVGLMILPGVITAAGVLATSHNFWPRFFFFEIGFALLILVRGAMVIANRVGGARSREIGMALVVLLVIGSIVPLRKAYFYPKQDYQGAMRFVEHQRGASESIATAGIVSMPFQQYYGRSWPMIETPEELSRFVKDEHGTWLLYVMPGSIRSSQPELWEGIESRFEVVRKFPGTLGGGEIYVSRVRDSK